MCAVNPPLWGSLECSRVLWGGDSLWWTGREAHAGWTQRPEAGPPGLEDKRWLASGLPGLPWASEGPGEGGETSKPQQHLPNQIVSCSPQQGGAGPDTRSREEESQDLLPAGLPRSLPAAGQGWAPARVSRRRAQHLQEMPPVKAPATGVRVDSEPHAAF